MTEVMPLFMGPTEFRLFATVLVTGLVTTGLFARGVVRIAHRLMESRCRGTAGRLALSAATSVVVIYIWDFLYVSAIHLSLPYAGAPDGGVSTSVFMFVFAFSAYMRDYLHAPVSHSLFLLAVAGSGYLLLGAVLRSYEKGDWRAHGLGAIVYGLLLMRGMTYVVEGYEGLHPLSFFGYLLFAMPAATGAAVFLMLGEAVAELAMRIIRAGPPRPSS